MKTFIAALLLTLSCATSAQPIDHIALVLAVPGTSVSATVGGTEISSSRIAADLFGKDFARVTLDADALNLSVRVEYSTDNGSSWDTLVTKSNAGASGSTTSSFVNIPAGAQTDVLLRAMAVGVLTTAVRFVEVEVRE